MRRRRTRKYTWLPILGQEIAIGTEQWDTASFGTDVAVPRGGTAGLYVVPVLADRPNENYGVTDHIGDVLTNDYFLKRIVGKLHVALQQDGRAYSVGVPPSPVAAVVTAGFFVARVDSTQSTVGPDYPIGLNATTDITNYENYSPGARSTSREPWIWRRTWVLSNRIDAETLLLPGAAQKDAFRYFPATNAEYGSVADGPHIDAKTARRVTNDERLFFAIGAMMPAVMSYTPANDSVVSFNLDIRCLGALRKSRNRGVF